MADERFEQWVRRLEHAHLSNLTFPEVSRALRALSSAYVERRGRLAEGAALSGAGKRAAFALFYGPLHYLLVRSIVRSLPTATKARPLLIDLGCGTGAAGAAWASALTGPPSILGVDRNPWAASEARETYRDFGLSGRTRVGDAARAELSPGAGVIAAFTINELADGARAALLPKLMRHVERGGAVLIVEPLAGFVAPWWREWANAFEGHGGRADEWRVREPLPAIVAKLDRAAGLNHREITGRSLWIEGNAPTRGAV
jgi:SAM-dependent methyltransferase